MWLDCMWAVDSTFDTLAWHVSMFSFRLVTVAVSVSRLVLSSSNAAFSSLLIPANGFQLVGSPLSSRCCRRESSICRACTVWSLGMQAGWIK